MLGAACLQKCLWPRLFVCLRTNVHRGDANLLVHTPLAQQSALALMATTGTVVRMYTDPSISAEHRVMRGFHPENQGLGHW